MERQITEDLFDFDTKVDAITEYFECAGFDDFYNRVVKNMSRESIEDSFHELFFGECGDELLLETYLDY
jgi:hypothetical protein